MLVWFVGGRRAVCLKLFLEESLSSRRICFALSGDHSTQDKLKISKGRLILWLCMLCMNNLSLYLEQAPREQLSHGGFDILRWKTGHSIGRQSDPQGNVYLAWLCASSK